MHLVGIPHNTLFAHVVGAADHFVEPTIPECPENFLNQRGTLIHKLYSNSDKERVCKLTPSLLSAGWPLQRADSAKRALTERPLPHSAGIWRSGPHARAVDVGARHRNAPG